MDIFENEDTETITNEIDPNKNYLEELVGEDKKFKDVESLARGKAQSDMFIERILSEQEELRNELKQRVNMEKVLDELKTFQTKSQQQNELEVENNQTTNESSNKENVLTPEQLQELIDQRLTQKDRESTAQHNRERVNNELVKKYGSIEVARSEINRKVKELNIPSEIFKQLAETSPDAVLAYFKEASRLPDTTVTATRLNTSASNQTSSGYSPTGERKMSWYKDLKKRDPVAYHSKEMTIQRHRDAARIGEAFFDV